MKQAHLWMPVARRTATAAAVLLSLAVTGSLAATAADDPYHGLKTVTLENQHLRLVVLPKVGGRLLGLFNSTADALGLVGKPALPAGRTLDAKVTFQAGSENRLFVKGIRQCREWGVYDPKTHLGGLYPGAGHCGMNRDMWQFVFEFFARHSK